MFVTSVTRALITDVRLYNEMCNIIICQKRAVMPFAKKETRDWALKQKQRANEAQTTAQKETICF